MRAHNIFIVALVLVALIAPTYSSKVSDQIYTTVDARGCFRRSNRNGSTGCGSINRYGDTGILRLVNDTSSLNSITGFRRDFIAVVTADFLSREAIDALAASRHLRGIITLMGDSDGGPTPGPTFFSPLPSTPWSEVDVNYNADTPYQWLPDGTGLQLQQLPVAMASVAGTEARRLYSLAAANEEKQQSGGALRHRARMSYFMSTRATDSAATCLADRTCLPLGGYSAWASFGNVTQGRGWVLATLPLDGHALADSRATAAHHVAAPLAAWLGAAHALGRAAWRNVTAGAESEANSVLPVVFAALNGEQWSRAGSRAFVQDVKLGSGFVCDVPVKDAAEKVVACMRPYRIDLAHAELPLSSLAAVLELGALASPRVYTHAQRDGVSAALQADVAWVAALPSNAPFALNVSTAHADTPGLPPSAAAQAVVAAESTVPAVLLADFDKEFDPLMGSMFDGVANAGKDRGYNHLCAAATAYARTLALQAGVGSRAANNSAPLLAIEADCEFVWELAQCFLRQGRCQLLQTLSPTAFPTAYAGPPSFHSGVYRPAFPSHIRGFPRLAHDVLAAAAYNATRASYPDTPVEWLARRRWAHFHDGLAPEFELDFDNDVFVVKNGSGLAWTSSNYGEVGVVTFQAEDGRVVLAVGIAGAVVCAITGVIGLLLMKMINYQYNIQ